MTFLILGMTHIFHMATLLSVGNKPLEFSQDTDIKSEKNFCQLSGDRGQRLLRKTLPNHMKPQFWPLITESGYFFCPNRSCPVVYFNNENGKYFGLDDVHTVVMHKIEIGTENRPVCYCKNVLEKTILDELLVKKCCDSIIDIQNFTEANTGKDCVLTNPTGRCCGKQIKEILEWTKDQRMEIEAPLMQEAMSCCARIDEATEESFENMLKAADA